MLSLNRKFKNLLAAGLFSLAAGCGEGPQVPQGSAAKDPNMTGANPRFPNTIAVKPGGDPGDFEGEYAGACDLTYRSVAAKSCFITMSATQGAQSFKINANLDVNLGASDYLLKLDTEDFLITGNDLYSLKNQIDSGDIGASSFWVYMDANTRLQMRKVGDKYEAFFEVVEEGEYLSMRAILEKSSP